VAQPEVDPDRIVLMGRSFAGYLAPRAAAHDHRVAALICDPAQPDMAAHLPGGVVGKVLVPGAKLQAKLSATRAEFFGARMAAHGLTRIEDYFTELRRFTMLADAGAITCPTLIVEAQNDFAGGGGATLQAALTCPNTLVRLTAEQGADGHCAGLGQEVWNDAVFGWLAQTLASLTDRK
jgi:pimeloyl-ACP methyl ester carboxylesterase